jgi:amino acid adenylation domain-containing protein
MDLRPRGHVGVSLFLRPTATGQMVVNQELLELLDECRRGGIVLALENSQLRARGDAAALTPELRSALKRHRTAIMEMLGAGQDKPGILEPVFRERAGDQPVSSAQHRLWFVTELAPESSVAYHIVAAVRIGGALNVPVLERALAEIVRRHNVLRTAFVSVQGQPCQRIDPAATLSLRRAEVTSDETAITRLLLEEAQVPFDLEQSPLVRGVLARIDEHDQVLALIVHHLVSDGWSSGVIIDEVAALYSAYSAGQPSPLPPLPLQYADYVEWQQQVLTGPAFDADVAFWRDTLDGVPTLTLPTDHPRPPFPSYAGSSERFVLPHVLTNQLNDLSRREGATLFMTLLAAFAVLLSRYSGQHDLAIGTTVANRPRTTLESLVGFFTNMLAMRMNVDGELGFDAFLGRVRGDVRAALQREHVPFDRVVEAVQPERIASHNPLVQVCFSFLQAHRDTLRLGDLDVVQIDPPSPASRFDLTLMMEDTAAGLVGAFEYSTDLFERETIVRLIGHWQTLLESLVTEPERSIADHSLLGSAERNRILMGWNDSTTAYPRDAVLHELVEEQVARRPDAIAVRADGMTLTYSELNARANRLARKLRSYGVGPDKAVAVAALRSAAMIVELLAVLKAGGYYVPFDPTDPPDRLAFVFEQVNPLVILAPESAVSGLARHDLPILSGGHKSGNANIDVSNLDTRVGPENLAYTTYTSGSTGVPKGICIVHRGVVRLVRQTNYMTFDSSLVFLEIAPVSFDASTLEIWGALASGGELVVLPPHVPSLRDLGLAIERHSVTSLYLTSALFNLMVDERVAAFANVKHLLVGGDIISVPHARRLLEANPGVTLINGYGPTETTTFASCGIMSRPEHVGYTVTIGRPISNTTLYVLDSRMTPQPVGVPGDLFIAGDGNARGYLNLPGLTAEAFVPNPFGTPGARMYRTGDLARYRCDGTLEFLGRRDNQVKVRGFRIELGEIENVLAAVGGVSEVAVLVSEIRSGDKRLTAYVQQQADGELTESVCVAALRERLPDYMVPSAFVFVDAFPLTPHNKLDRKALSLLAPTQNCETQFVLPTSALESVIARIWRETLDVERVGVTDDFFDLGGHSLLATQVMWRVFETFNVEVPLRRLFDAPTVGEFVAALEEVEGSTGRLMRVAELHEEVFQLTDDEVSLRLEEPVQAGYDQ